MVVPEAGGKASGRMTEAHPVLLERQEHLLAAATGDDVAPSRRCTGLLVHAAIGRRWRGTFHDAGTGMPGDLRPPRVLDQARAEHGPPIAGPAAIL